MARRIETLGRSTQRTIRSNRVRVRPANVDVIVTGGNAALAVKQTTSAIPIIFVLAVDPVRMGLHSAGFECANVRTNGSAQPHASYQA